MDNNTLKIGDLIAVSDDRFCAGAKQSPGNPKFWVNTGMVHSLPAKEPALVIAGYPDWDFVRVWIVLYGEQFLMIEPYIMMQYARIWSPES